MIEIDPEFRFAANGPLRDVIDPQDQDVSFEQRTSDSLRVLVVDDEKLVADTLSDILGGAGFVVLAVYDGVSAMEIVSGFEPDYLLTDVLMPGMNGVELAIEIQRLHPLVKVLLFSGQAGISEILNNGKQRGFEFEIIAKPIHPLKLIERLNSSE